MQIRTAVNSDAPHWERMRQALWPSSPGEHAAAIAEYFAGPRRNPAEVFLAIDSAGDVVGFAEVSIRTCAEGCHTDRVAFLEGWYVDQAARRCGYGAALVRAAEAWGRSQGCTEMGSDTEIDNVISAAAHLAVGFDEVNRSINFRKAL